MKYRFYYSESQLHTMRQLYPGHRTFVFDGTKYVEYSEMCSRGHSKCNWRDAKLVFETDVQPKIKVEDRLPPEHLEIHLEIKE